MDDTLLKITDLSISFPQRNNQNFTAVKCANFSITHGETFALVGESGSGKSLTALSIMQLLPLTALLEDRSNIFFRGKDLTTFSEIEMHGVRGRKISMIFQEPMSALNPVFTIGEQIGEVLEWHFHLTGHAQREKVFSLLDAVGISDVEIRYHYYPHQLSGGQQQRSMIAMALAGNPDLLIADEPTTALDVSIQAQILQLLRTLQNQYGMAILLITHDLGVVRQMANRVAVMKAGEIVEQAYCQEFFAHPSHPYSQQLFSELPSFEKRSHSLVSSTKEVLFVPIREQKNALPLLEVKNLKVYFRFQHNWFSPNVLLKAVDDVSFTLHAGKTLAIVGESGSGKTTLVKSILQLMPMTQGDVFFNQQLLTNMNKKQLQKLRRELQIIFQDPYSALNPRMLIGDIVAEGLLVHEPMLSHKEREERVNILLKQVSLPMDAQFRYPHEFSGGQRQRICIARALALKPRLLICDEPTSALDVSVQAQILDLLRKLQQELQLSYLFISHNIAVVAYLADDIAVMQAGKIVEMGTAEQILYSPKHPYTKALLSAVPVV